MLLKFSDLYAPSRSFFVKELESKLVILAVLKVDKSLKIFFFSILPKKPGIGKILPYLLGQKLLISFFREMKTKKLVLKLSHLYALSR